MARARPRCRPCKTSACRSRPASWWRSWARADRARARRRGDAVEAVQGREGQTAAPHNRLRVPGFQPAARAHRGGERLAAAGARRAHREKGPRRGHPGSRRARADRAGGALPRRALRRRAAAGRDRTRDSWQPQARPRRRAVRRARLGNGGDGDADAGCRVPPRRGHGGRHPRRAARLVGGPGGGHQRWPHRQPNHPAGEPRVAAAVGTEPMTAVLDRPTETGGGVPARRAVLRWALRLFRRGWRQQLLVLTLITGAGGATIFGAAVGTNLPLPANAGFGSANALVNLPGNDPHLASEIAALKAHFGAVDVIENQVFATGLVTG